MTSKKQSKKNLKAKRRQALRARQAREARQGEGVAAPPTLETADLGPDDATLAASPSSMAAASDVDLPSPTEEELEPGAELEPEPQAELEPESEPAAELEPEAEPEAELEPESEPAAELEPEAEPEAEPMVALAAAGADLEPVAELDTEPDEDEEPGPLPPSRLAPVLAQETKRSGAWGRRSMVIVAACIAALLAVAGAVSVAGLIKLSGGPGQTLSRATLSAAYDSPVQLADNASYVRTRVLPSGDLLVTHWIRSDERLSWVTVTVPSVAELPASSVTVHHLVVRAGGVLMPQSPGVGRNGARTFVLGAAQEVYVRYRLSGVLQRDSALSDRALARITSLDVAGDIALASSTRVVEGAKVLALACSVARPRAVPVPCGDTSTGAWQARLKGDATDDRVMAQVELSGSW